MSSESEREAWIAGERSVADAMHYVANPDNEREAIIDALLDELGWDWDEVPEEHIPSSREILGDMADRVLAVSAGFGRAVQREPSDTALIAWHVEQVELLRPFRRSSAHLNAAMMHAATVRALRAGVVSVQGEPESAPRDEAEALYPFDGGSPNVILALRSAYRAGVDREGRAALRAVQAPEGEEKP